MTIHSNIEVEEREQNRDEIYVSLFSSYSNSSPIGTVGLSAFLLQPKYREQVETVRRCKDKARRRELKSKLPAVTPSGIFSTRSNSGLIRHSGFICLDIDQNDNPNIDDWAVLKSSISDLAGLWYAGLSVSGSGLFLIFRIKYPEKHAENFNALDRELRKRGISIDAACKDISRLRGASYDPKPFYNPAAINYESLISTHPTKTVREPAGTASMALNDPDLTAIRVGKLVDTIERTGTNIADYYPDWYAIGRSLASEFGESGRDWFHTISRQSRKYKPAECDRQYSRCLAACSKTSISTLFWYCKQHGVYS